MEIRDQFDDAIGVAPPAAVDVDRLMAKERKIAVVRRWGTGGGLVAAVLGIAVASSLVLGGGGTSGGIPAAGPGGVPAGEVASPSADSPLPEPCRVERSEAPGSGESLASPAACDAKQPRSTYDPKVAKRLEKAVRDAMTEQLPDTDFVGYDEPGRKRPFQFLDEKQDSYHLWVDTRDTSGKGSIAIVVEKGHTATTCAPGLSGWDGLANHQISCKESTGDGGEKIVSVTSDNSNEQQDATKRITSNMIFVTKPDGTTVWLLARNIDTASIPEESEKGYIHQPTRPQPPITTDQMIKVALDPGLTLK